MEFSTRQSNEGSSGSGNAPQPLIRLCNPSQYRNRFTHSRQQWISCSCKTYERAINVFADIFRASSSSSVSSETEKKNQTKVENLFGRGGGELGQLH
ncbi:hypothetical protein CsatB_027563 [Cannabis sativa]